MSISRNNNSGEQGMPPLSFRGCQPILFIQLQSQGKQSSDSVCKHIFCSTAP